MVVGTNFVMNPRICDMCILHIIGSNESFGSIESMLKQIQNTFETSFIQFNPT